MSSVESLSQIRNRVPSISELQEYSTRETSAGILFSLPYLLLFTVFLLYPLLKGLYMSFFNWDAVFPAQSTFVGLQNYSQMFADPLFWKSLQNTVYFVILTVPPLLVVPLFLALGVNRNIKGRGALRVIFFSPYILTVSVVGLLWQNLFQSNGLINYWLGTLFGITPGWLIDPLLAMPAIAIATVWWSMAFNFVVLLAARQNVPDRLYEAAKLDGASSWRMLRDITLPQMRHPLLFVVILSFIGSFQVFGQPYVMTGGGPAFSTQTIVMYIYSSAFSGREFGYAAAIGYVLFLILIVVSLINYYVLGGSE